jgi:hypothetical protein
MTSSITLIESYKLKDVISTIVNRIVQILQMHYKTLSKELKTALKKLKLSLLEDNISMTLKKDIKSNLDVWYMDGHEENKVLEDFAKVYINIEIDGIPDDIFL